MNVEELRKLTKVCDSDLFDYESSLKHLGYKQKDVNDLRDKIFDEKIIPKYVTNGQVCLKRIKK